MDDGDTGEFSLANIEARLAELKAISELLSMAIEAWPATDEPLNELSIMKREAAFIAMWPTACTRAGQAIRPFPSDLLNMLMKARRN